MRIISQNVKTVKDVMRSEPLAMTEGPLDDQIGDFLKRITTGDREQRLQACVHFQRLLIASDAEPLGRYPFQVLYQLDEQFFVRLSPEVKEAIAKCIGIVGFVSITRSREFIDWLFDNYEKHAGDDIKALYMKSLVTLYELDAKQEIKRLEKYTGRTLSELRKALEVADSAQLLEPLLGLCQIISHSYPALFQPHFQDISDILIGWCIDIEQREAVIKQCEAALHHFKPFWVADSHFCMNLLGQFLEDAQAYAQDLIQGGDGVSNGASAGKRTGSTASSAGSGESTPAVPVTSATVGASPRECQSRIRALLRVYRTLLTALEEYLTAAASVVPESQPVATAFMAHSLKRLQACLETLLAPPGHANVAQIVNAVLKCWSLLLRCAKPYYASLMPALIGAVSPMVPPDSQPLLLPSYAALLNYLHQLICNAPSDSLTSYVGHLIGPEGILFRMRPMSSKQIRKRLLELYCTLIKPRGVSCLQEVYRHILGELNLYLTRMRELAPEPLRVQSEAPKLVDKNPFAVMPDSWKLPEVDRLEAEICFLMTVLLEIGNAKNSVIAMWALSPSLFDMLCDRFPIRESWLLQCYPAAVQAILTTLKSHCQKHELFLSSSNFLVSASAAGSTSSGKVMNSPTSKNFGAILRLVTAVLKSDGARTDILQLCLRWCRAVCRHIENAKSESIFALQDFNRLATIVLDKVALAGNVGQDAETTVSLILKVASLQLNDSFYHRLLEICVELCSRLPVTQTWLKNVPLHVWVMQLDTSSSERVSSCSIKVADARSAVHKLSATPSGTVILPHQFASLMGFLLNGQLPADFPSYSGAAAEVGSIAAWEKYLEQLFRTTARSYKLHKGHTAFGQGAFLWFWTCWQLAQFCVSSRLKTPLGKPQDTFLAIETCLKTLAHDVVSGRKQAAEKNTGDDGSGYLTLSWVRMRLLLWFCEALDKYMFMAYEGPATFTVPVHKSSRAFFVANRNTCIEWLSRIRLAEMTVAFHGHNHALVLRLAVQAFQDLPIASHRQSVPNVEALLSLVAGSMIALGEEGALTGVLTWATNLLGSKPQWLKMAVEKSRGRHEAAIAGWRELIKSLENGNVKIGLEGNNGLLKSSATTLSPHLFNFVVNQTVESYMCLDDYQTALDWLTDLESSTSFADWMESDPAVNVTSSSWHHIRSLGVYDADIEHKEKPLSSPAWTRAFIDDKLTQSLAAAILEPDDSALRDNLGKAVWQCEQWESALLMPLNFAPTTSLAHILPHTLRAKELDLAKLSTAPIPLDLMTRLIFWFRLTLRTQEKDDVLADEAEDSRLRKLYRMTSHVARQGGNLDYASRLLRNALGQSEASGLKDAIKAVKLELPVLPYLRAAQEAAQILHASADAVGAFETLYDGVTTVLDSDGNSEALANTQDATGDLDKPMTDGESATDDIQRRIARLGLDGLMDANNGEESTLKNRQSTNAAVGKGLGRLARWMEQAGDSAENYGSVLLRKEESLLVKLLEEQLLLAEASLGGGALDSNSVVGALQSLSVRFCPSNSSSQLALADWAYQAAQKALTGHTEDRLLLNESQLAEFDACLPNGTSTRQRTRILDAFCALPSQRNENIVAMKLGAVIGSADVGPLVLLWRRIHTKIYQHFDMAAKGYFNFLQLGSPSAEASIAKNKEMEEGECEETKNSESVVVKATLRLMHLLLRHSAPLRLTLDEGFRRTHPHPWKRIIPQLLARLSHRDLWVRRRVGELLGETAAQAPHLVAYQAVVGALSSPAHTPTQTEHDMLFDVETAPARQGGANEDDLSLDSIADDAKGDQVFNASENNLVQDSYGELVSRLDGRLVEELKKFIRELQRITLLRDELWTTALTHLQHEMSRRLRQLEKDVDKTRRNTWLTDEEKEAIKKEKGSILTQMLCKMVEGVCAVTLGVAETPHDQWFLDSYGPLIEKTRKRCLEDLPPQEAWESFQTLLGMLMQRAGKKSSLSLDLRFISPQLWKCLEPGLLPMPGGMCDEGGQPVRVVGVEHHVSVLPTKTKPKKLYFVGSDGKRYGYLFKGLEDLHLDERIMQFLQVCNALLKGSPSRQGNVFHARNYSVTPLGARAGLIQWVDGATPIFHLYKRWQIRQAGLTNQGAGATDAAITVPRPSELFYGKLAPALEARGIRDLDTRKEWPTAVLKQVLGELIAETPSDLIQKELWCSSSDAEGWWAVTQRHAQSEAVMGMIGYVLGLGDRHLDNLLLDLRTGDIVHVDYNICFGKGARLQVPEKVPFRLTHNIQRALGLTGIEGTFRTSAHQVLAVLREEREMLLSLLEAFVYDPLVDWTPLHDAAGVMGHHLMLAVYGTTRIGDYRNLAHDLAARMLRVRIWEVRGNWVDNQSVVKKGLQELADALDAAQEEQSVYHRLASKLHSLEAQKSLIQEALSDSEHSLYSLPQRVEEYAVVGAAWNEAQEKLRLQQESCQEWMTAYKKSFERMRNLLSFRRRMAQLNLPSEAPVSLVAVFLQNAGQSALIQQCKEAELELSVAFGGLKSLSLRLVESIAGYAAIQQNMPLSRFFGHRIYQWHGWLSQAGSASASGQLREILDEMSATDQARELWRSRLVPATMETVVTETVAAGSSVASRLAMAETNRSVAEAAEAGLGENSQMSSQLEVLQATVPRIVELAKRSLALEAQMVSCRAANSSRFALMDHVTELGQSAGLLGYFGQLLLNVDRDLASEQVLPNYLEFQLALELISAKLGEMASALASVQWIIMKRLMPTLLKMAISEQAGFSYLVANLSQLVQLTGLSPASLIEQISTSSLGGEIPAPELILSIQTLQIQYWHLMQEMGRTGDYSTSLLHGCVEEVHGSFVRVGTACRELGTMLAGSNFLPWSQLDIIQEALAIEVPLFAKLREEMVFLVELQCLSQCLSYASEYAVKVTSKSTSALTLEECVLGSAEDALLSCYQHCAWGLASRAVTWAAVCGLGCVSPPASEEFLAAVEECSEAAVFAQLALSCHQMPPENQLANAQLLHCFGLAQSASAKSLYETEIDMLTAAVALIRCIGEVYGWLWETLTATSTPLPTLLSISSRAAFLAEITQSSDSISIGVSAVTESQEKVLAVEAVVTQRLKWAAGANPDVADQLQLFEVAQTQRKQLIEDVHCVCQDLSQLCVSVLHLEMLCGDGPEARDGDQNVETVIDKVLMAMELKESCTVSVSSVEEALLETKPTEDGAPIERNYLTEADEAVNTSLEEVSREAAESQSSLAKRQAGLLSLAHSTRNILAAHHKIMLELRSVIKTLAKQEQESSPTSGGRKGSLGPFSAYIVMYKHFSERLAAAVKSVASLELATNDVAPVLTALRNLAQTLDRVYEGLLMLGDEKLQNSDSGTPAWKQWLDDDATAGTLPGAQRESVVEEPLKNTASADHATEKPATTENIGLPSDERNAQALAIWEVVKQKLEGRPGHLDPSQTTAPPLTVQQQVDEVIGDATSQDNLALMYEGWTAWV